MAESKTLGVFKTIGRVLRWPVRIVLLLATIASVPLSWLHVMSRNWEAIALTVAVIFLLSAVWELHQETHKQKVVNKAASEPTLQELILRADARYLVLRPLVDQARAGDLLWQRCPKGTGKTLVPLDFLTEVAEWEKKTSETLAPFPSQRSQFIGPVVFARGADAEDQTTQEVGRRTFLLKTIIGQLVEQFDAGRPTIIASGTANMSLTATAVGTWTLPENRRTRVLRWLRHPLSVRAGRS
jgi:membrane protein YdbS with pleckstrin-like domain